MTIVYEALDLQVRAYLGDVLTELRRTPLRAADPDHEDDAALADDIFSLVTSRQFCYLGRTKADRYREDVTAQLARRIAEDEPFRFFYDIGPGYHATTRPGLVPLRFDVGLSELLILTQVGALCARIRELYGPGAHFWLVIDNVCALRTNDIPLARTEEYVRQLRRLIESSGLADTVSLIVESESFSLEEYDAALAQRERQEPPTDLTPEAIDNVARFLGRPCDAVEAAERIELYTRTGPTTDGLIDRLVAGVHMTQRATGATLGFRPFPGGDQRTQAGDLVLTHDAKGKMRPVLVTTRNVDRFDCTELPLHGLLPEPLEHVVYATPATRPEYPRDRAPAPRGQVK